MSDMGDLKMGMLTVQRTEDGAPKALFGGRGLHPLEMAAGFAVAGLLIAVVAIADRLRPEDDPPCARTPRSGRSPT